MLILGDLSGIQEYLLSIASQHGGQSRRLRARSFFLQAVTEIAAWRLLEAAHWSPEIHLLWNAAGKFALEGDLEEEHQKAVRQEAQEISEWLREHTGAALHFHIALSAATGKPAFRNAAAHSELRRNKQQPWHSLAVSDGCWNPQALILPAVSPPCQICRKHPAASVINDDKGGGSCRICQQDDRLGKTLPEIKWMVVHSVSRVLQTATAGTLSANILGVLVTFHSHFPNPSPSQKVIYALREERPPSGNHLPVIHRHLAQHLPSRDDGTPMDFDAMALAASGAPYLGVLKMDVDSLGGVFAGTLEQAADWKTFQEFSVRLDRFFAMRLNQEMEKPDWQKLYTVFAGGDDLLIVGPWDIAFRFAGVVHELFQREFGKEKLTISAGLAIVTARFPIHRAVAQAAEHLEAAKDGGKNRFGAFGQVWEWQHHGQIVHQTNCLTGWVRDKSAERGWLQTLLRFLEQRDHPDPEQRHPASEARLAYHIFRNYPKDDDFSAPKRALRAWINQIARDWRKQQQIETRYLRTIVQYALMATRSQTGDNK